MPAKQYRRWAEIKDKGFTPERRARVAKKVREMSMDLDLRAIRELAGKTQVEVAEATKMTQSEVSRLEHRDDYLLSTLRRYVEALGGELQVIAKVGDKAVHLRSVG